ncbi:ECF transporter S component [Dysosmobacter welbionis]|uniref:ECF transporter S component n=1 Tax=Dysosmobacter welbionis TaxID=2093857 RepID=UPI00300EC313
MYAHPFSADYWRDASREVRDLRKLLFSALMIALCIVLAQVPSVPLFGGAKVTWGFLARSVCAWVCGPVLGLLFAFAEDILSFFLTGGGGYPFFPGYTLTTMLGVLTYALFLYRAPLRVWRISAPSWSPMCRTWCWGRCGSPFSTATAASAWRPGMPARLSAR